MPSPKKKPVPTKEDLVQINLRLPQSLMEQLDAWISDERAARPGITVTRTDLIRQAIYQAVEQRSAPKKKT